ncbi:hypothetical protein AZI86_11530 [Bdellovibrio bacteriovorus]|uniref:Uncharacterized protein n=1 Tax=Bdellovibrio bacteriovorus TaxID=959 RepID=A0A150WLP3_BDEBC|nr:DUF4258 domain-containing protein [Bdellovibrio bacteriovorus]KYG64826.1 hypothetical protein AZI86_11530 [Bdellovibrio bacteriovorus]
MSIIDIIKDDLVSGNFRLTLHARQRMDQRRVTLQDIRICAKDGEIFVDGDEFNLIGLDLEDRDLTVVCAYRHGTLIVTVK